MKANKVTNDIFDAKLEELVDGMTGAQILAIQGIYEVLSEALNDDVLELLGYEDGNTDDGREDNDIHIYSIGPLSMSVCAPEEMSPDEVAERANALEPTGISSRWEIAEEDHFATGESMPCSCNTELDRRHWLLYC